MIKGDGKMTAVVENRLDERKYGRLLARALPKAVETQAEYAHMLEEVNRLMSKGEDRLTPEEDALLELLFTLIEKYEGGRFELNASTPRGILVELMEARGVKPCDLWRVLGSKGSTSEVLNNKRGISKAQAKALGEFFHVSSELFI
jgi:HTH-type transcriptional regulator/antitoxin HigA